VHYRGVVNPGWATIVIIVRCTADELPSGRRRELARRLRQTGLSLGSTSRTAMPERLPTCDPQRDPCQILNNPHGWREIVKFLKEAGYAVVCVDRKRVSF
jgi:hypothetical protein